jgi:putative phosphoribosyl transferase
MDAPTHRFQNRAEAGVLLALKLTHYADRNDVLVLALPRGGLPVAFEIARFLHVPLDVFLVRKLAVPGHDELAMGAVATGNVRVLDSNTIQAWGISPLDIESITTKQLEELTRRERLYRRSREAPDVHGRTVILVDDGVATGSTMDAAVVALKQLRPARIIVAVAVASPEIYQELIERVDEVVCIKTPEPFRAVGMWFEDFLQLNDDDVRNILERADHRKY